MWEPRWDRLSRSTVTGPSTRRGFGLVCQIRFHHKRAMEGGCSLCGYTHTHTPFYSLIYALTTLWHTPTNNTFGTWWAEVVLG